MKTEKPISKQEQAKLKNIIEQRINKVLREGIEFLHKVRSCERRNAHGN